MWMITTSDIIGAIMIALLVPPFFAGWITFGLAGKYNIKSNAAHWLMFGSSIALFWAIEAAAIMWWRA